MVYSAVPKIHVRTDTCNVFHNLADNGSPGQVWTGNSAARTGLTLRLRYPAGTPHGVERSGAALLTSAVLRSLTVTTDDSGSISRSEVTACAYAAA